MKHIRKFFQTIMAMALAVCLTSMPVMAQEVTDYDVVQQEHEAVTYASVPSGYTRVATYSSSPQTYYLGTTSVRSTSTFQLYLPNKNRQDWIQGNVKFTPVGSGTTKEFGFTNLSGEYKTFDLSELTPGTTYDEHIKTTTELNAITYSERLIENIDHGIDITNSLEQVIISNDGQINNFDTISANLLSNSIQSIQLAPDGIITDIYPEAATRLVKLT